MMADTILSIRCLHGYIAAEHPLWQVRLETIFRIMIQRVKAVISRSKKLTKWLPRPVKAQPALQLRSPAALSGDKILYFS